MEGTDGRRVIPRHQEGKGDCEGKPREAGGGGGASVLGSRFLSNPAWAGPGSPPHKRAAGQPRGILPLYCCLVLLSLVLVLPLFLFLYGENLRQQGSVCKAWQPAQGWLLCPALASSAGSSRSCPTWVEG